MILWCSGACSWRQKEGKSAETDSSVQQCWCFDGSALVLNRSRRDKQAVEQAKTKKDQVIFQQVTLFRLNPLGVRGHKDLMVV